MQENGETTQVGTRCKERLSDTERKRLGLVFSQSQVNGTEQIGISGENRQGGNSARTRDQGENSAGKTLERLELIENAYFEYVESHQKNLEFSLIESKKRTEAFKQAIQELKQEVYQLVSAEEEISEESQ